MIRSGVSRQGVFRQQEWMVDAMATPEAHTIFVVLENSPEEDRIVRNLGRIIRIVADKYY
jgi:hypothetical protein